MYVCFLFYVNMSKRSDNKTLSAELIKRRKSLRLNPCYQGDGLPWRLTAAVRSTSFLLLRMKQASASSILSTDREEREKETSCDDCEEGKDVIHGDRCRDESVPILVGKHARGRRPCFKPLSLSGLMLL